MDKNRLVRHDGIRLVWRFGAVFMFLFWILIIVGIIGFIKWLVEGSSSGTSKKSALEILNEKYAGGEINDEEYEKRRRKLLRA